MHVSYPTHITQQQNSFAEQRDAAGAMQIFFDEMVEAAQLRPNEVAFGTLMKARKEGRTDGRARARWVVNLCWRACLLAVSCYF